MWTKPRASYVLLSTLLATVATAQTAAPGSAAGDVLLTMPINVDGTLKDLQLLRGESYEQAAVSFVRNNGLLNVGDDTRVREVVGQLSGLLKDKMEELDAAERSKKPAQPVAQLAIEMSINGFTSELMKYEGESVEAAVERYLYASGFTLDVMRELYPQLVEVVNEKLASLKPSRKELFSFSLTIDGREAIARHFENGNPMAEAEDTLRAIGINDNEFIGRIAPQIANEIAKRISGPVAQPPPPQQPPQQQPPAQESMPPKEVFSMPLTVNERNVILVHYEGSTSRETAARFLTTNGLTDAESVNQLLPQLVQIVDNRIAQLLKEEAEKAAAAQPAAQAASPREPVVRLPINLGNNQEVFLEYFAGDSIERTVELFLTNIGVPAGPAFHENAQRLSGLVREELSKKTTTSEQTPPRVEPALSLPITLGGRVFQLEYFAGQEPASVANTFCVEKHEIIRAELGLQFDGNQLQECKTVLTGAINDFLAQQQQQPPQTTTQQPPAPVQQQEQQPSAEPTAERGSLLFTLDIGVDGESLPLDVHQNDVPEQVAREFCQRHNIDLGNVPALVEAIQTQRARVTKPKK